MVRTLKNNHLMKFQNWIKILCLATLSIILITGCESPTPKPLTGDGDVSIEDLDAQGEMETQREGDMGVKEQERISTKNGVEYGKWEAIHFDYDSATIHESDRHLLGEIAQWTKDNPDKKLMTTGHCDERGTLEYNLALGQRRASATRNYLVKLGVPASRIGTLSYGEEQPVDSSHNESAWAKNRRAELGIIE